MTNIVAIAYDPHWTDRLMRNSRGVPLGNLRNALYALRNAPDWDGVLAYDEFAEHVITTKALPWGGAAVDGWGDEHDTRACEWMQEQGIPASLGIVGRAVQAVAGQNGVHPVRDFLNNLKWDGTARIESWLTTYLGAEDSVYVRAVGPRFLISAVARILVPGCQVDHMLILEGDQGIQKSSALEILAHPWFSDRISRPGSKDSAMEVAGVWMIEWAELDALTKASNSAIKAFVTRRYDRFRPPYGRHVVQRPRQCVFAGTINPAGGYLSDPTGARRFWPVACGVINLEGLARDRDQLWAEAVARYRDRGSWWLETPELDALAKAEQALRFKTDAWAERAADWLVGRNDVSVGEVLVGALGIGQDSWSQTSQNRIAAILGSNGFKQYRPGKAGQPRTPRYRRVVPVEQVDLQQIKFNKSPVRKP
jgi:predicted P-loop ATPase